MNALTTTTGTITALPAAIPAFNESDIRQAKDQIAKELNQEEFEWFIKFSSARGLNPLLKEIYAIKMGGKLNFVTSVDGFLKIAHRTGKLKGIERGVRKVGQDTYCFAKVWRSDWEHPIVEEINTKEYMRNTPTWNQMPEQMGKKCALTMALRMAFPENFGGVYGEEELGQGEKEDTSNFKANEQQISLKVLLDNIKQLQKKYDLSKEEIQACTGLETLKGCDAEQLEEAVLAITEYCVAKMEEQRGADEMLIELAELDKEYYPKD